MSRTSLAVAAVSATLGLTLVCPTAALAATTPAAAHPSAAHPSGGRLVVAAGETYEVTATTRLRSLVLEEGGALTVPDGSSLSLTVNGVETGSRLVTTAGTDTEIAPGTYRGDVVLTVATANPVDFFGLTFPFRQALYVGADGVDDAASVRSAVTGGRVTDTGASRILVRSKGEAFNGVYAAGDYTLRHARLRMTGNGRNDFAGDGAAVMGTGTDTRLVVDGSDVRTKGAVRMGLLATNGAHVVVKHTSISTADGTLPADYQPTIFPLQARSAPWMLGIVGNVRATSLVGDGTEATYVQSRVHSTGWGALSTDSTSNSQLTAIDTDVSTGSEGYGAYADGGSVTDLFLGSRFRVADYGVISTGGDVVLGDSSRAAVADADADLDLGLTAAERRRIPDQPTVVRSGRFGVMWHAGGQGDIDGGSVTIGGRTQLHTGQTTFLDKAVGAEVSVDGSQGARISSGTGVLAQVMESDDPGPQVVDGTVLNTGVYTEPTGDPVKSTTFDTTTQQSRDLVLNLADIDLRGDLYNGYRGSETTGKNLVLNLAGGRLAGVVSASTTKHAVSTITAADYKQLGEVTNTVSPVVNNGVIASLTDGARWTVTGTSYLSSLTVSADSVLRGSGGRSVTMAVDGVETPIVAGTTYTGAITLSLG